MFDFFRKNKKPLPATEPEPVTEYPPLATPAEPAPSETPAAEPPVVESVATPSPITANEIAETKADTPSKPWAERLKQGLARTRSQLGSQLTGLFSGGTIDEDVYEDLETILLTADIGVAATQTLLDQIRSRVKRQHLNNTSQLREALKDALLELLARLE
jgi:fused signal recognition particle receptor